MDVRALLWASLPSLPKGLETLQCSMMPNLTHLPKRLAAGLTELDCSGCRELAGLPALPGSLEILR